MAMRAELSADREQGAGYGLLRLTGLPAGLSTDSGPIDFSLRCNQGTAPFLGSDGRWQATEAWHSVGDTREDEAGALIVPLGPSIIDPIVSQPTNVTYLLTIAVGATKQATPVKLIRPLFGSGAAAPAIADPGPSPAEVQRQAEEEARRKAAADEATRLRNEEAERQRLAAEAAAAQQAAMDDAARQAASGRSRAPLIAGLGLGLLLVAGAAGAWYGCLIPGFGAGRCQQPAGVPPTPPPAAEAPLSCSGLDAAGCYQVASRALQQRQLEPARQLLQQAAGLGSIEATLAVGRMYDPQTWSAETSPAGHANWETAVFWYEKAARQGNVAAQTTAGRLLCQNAKSDLERGQGRAYLEQAANAGNAEARQLLSTCQ
ncbi:MAG: hypothetical protein U1E42_06290 [Rhodospirillales bacterium]